MDIKRVENDYNGNGRYVVHFFALLTEEEQEENIGEISYMYNLAIKRANKKGGRKYKGKDFGGGIVFQHSGSETQFKEFINSIKEEFI